MTINIETEIVGSSYDPRTGTCSYTVRKDGKEVTVEIPVADLDRHGGNRRARQTHLANKLTEALSRA